MDPLDYGVSDSFVHTHAPPIHAVRSVGPYITLVHPHFVRVSLPRPIESWSSSPAQQYEEDEEGVMCVGRRRTHLPTPHAGSCPLDYVPLFVTLHRRQREKLMHAHAGRPVPLLGRNPPLSSAARTHKSGGNAVGSTVNTAAGRSQADRQNAATAARRTVAVVSSGGPVQDARRTTSAGRATRPEGLTTAAAAPAAAVVERAVPDSVAAAMAQLHAHTAAPLPSPPLPVTALPSDSVGAPGQTAAHAYHHYHSPVMPQHHHHHHHHHHHYHSPQGRASTHGAPSALPTTTPVTAVAVDEAPPQQQMRYRVGRSGSTQLQPLSNTATAAASDVAHGDTTAVGAAGRVAAAAEEAAVREMAASMRRAEAAASTAAANANASATSMVAGVRRSLSPLANAARHSSSLSLAISSIRRSATRASSVRSATGFMDTTGAAATMSRLSRISVGGSGVTPHQPIYPNSDDNNNNNGTLRYGTDDGSPVEVETPRGLAETRMFLRPPPLTLRGDDDYATVRESSIAGGSGSDAAAVAAAAAAARRVAALLVGSPGAASTLYRSSHTGSAATTTSTTHVEGAGAASAEQQRELQLHLQRALQRQRRLERMMFHDADDDITPLSGHHGEGRVDGGVSVQGDSDDENTNYERGSAGGSGGSDGRLSRSQRGGSGVRDWDSGVGETADQDAEPLWRCSAHTREHTAGTVVASAAGAAVDNDTGGEVEAWRRVLAGKEMVDAVPHVEVEDEDDEPAAFRASSVHPHSHISLHRFRIDANDDDDDDGVVVVDGAARGPLGIRADSVRQIPRGWGVAAAVAARDRSGTTTTSSPSPQPEPSWTRWQRTAAPHHHHHHHSQHHDRFSPSGSATTAEGSPVPLPVQDRATPTAGRLAAGTQQARATPSAMMPDSRGAPESVPRSAAMAPNSSDRRSHSHLYALTASSAASTSAGSGGGVAAPTAAYASSSSSSSSAPPSSLSPASVATVLSVPRAPPPPPLHVAAAALSSLSPSLQWTPVDWRRRPSITTTSASHDGTSPSVTTQRRSCREGSDGHAASQSPPLPSPIQAELHPRLSAPTAAFTDLVSEMSQWPARQSSPSIQLAHDENEDTAGVARCDCAEPRGRWNRKGQLNSDEGERGEDGEGEEVAREGSDDKETFETAGHNASPQSPMPTRRSEPARRRAQSSGDREAEATPFSSSSSFPTASSSSPSVKSVGQFAPPLSRTMKYSRHASEGSAVEWTPEDVEAPVVRRTSPGVSAEDDRDQDRDVEVIEEEVGGEAEEGVAFQGNSMSASAEGERGAPALFHHHDREETHKGMSGLDITAPFTEAAPAAPLLNLADMLRLSLSPGRDDDDDAGVGRNTRETNSRRGDVSFAFRTPPQPARDGPSRLTRGAFSFGGHSAATPLPTPDMLARRFGSPFFARQPTPSSSAAAAETTTIVAAAAMGRGASDGGVTTRMSGEHEYVTSSLCGRYPHDDDDAGGGSSSSLASASVSSSPPSPNRTAMRHAASAGLAGGSFERDAREGGVGQEARSGVASPVAAWTPPRGRTGVAPQPSSSSLFPAPAAAAASAAIRSSVSPTLTTPFAALSTPTRAVNRQTVVTEERRLHASTASTVAWGTVAAFSPSSSPLAGQQQQQQQASAAMVRLSLLDPRVSGDTSPASTSGTHNNHSAAYDSNDVRLTSATSTRSSASAVFSTPAESRLKSLLLSATWATATPAAESSARAADTDDHCHDDDGDSDHHPDDDSGDGDEPGTEMRTPTRRACSGEEQRGRGSAASPLHEGGTGEKDGRASTESASMAAPAMLPPPFPPTMLRGAQQQQQQCFSPSSPFRGSGSFLRLPQQWSGASYGDDGRMSDGFEADIQLLARMTRMTVGTGEGAAPTGCPAAKPTEVSQPHTEMQQQQQQQENSPSSSPFRPSTHPLSFYTSVAAAAPTVLYAGMPVGSPAATAASATISTSNERCARSGSGIYGSALAARRSWAPRKTRRQRQRRDTSSRTAAAAAAFAADDPRPRHHHRPLRFTTELTSSPSPRSSGRCSLGSGSGSGAFLPPQRLTFGSAVTPHMAQRTEESATSSRPSPPSYADFIISSSRSSGGGGGGSHGAAVDGLRSPSLSSACQHSHPPPFASRTPSGRPSLASAELLRAPRRGPQRRSTTPSLSSLPAYTESQAASFTGRQSGLHTPGQQQRWEGARSLSHSGHGSEEGALGTPAGAAPRRRRRGFRPAALSALRSPSSAAAPARLTWGTANTPLTATTALTTTSTATATTAASVDATAFGTTMASSSWSAQALSFSSAAQSLSPVHSGRRQRSLSGSLDFHSGSVTPLRVPPRSRASGVWFQGRAAAPPLQPAHSSSSTVVGALSGGTFTASAAGREEESVPRLSLADELRSFSSATFATGIASMMMMPPPPPAPQHASVAASFAAPAPLTGAAVGYGGVRGTFLASPPRRAAHHHALPSDSSFLAPLPSHSSASSSAAPPPPPEPQAFVTRGSAAQQAAGESPTGTTAAGCAADAPSSTDGSAVHEAAQVGYRTPEKSASSPFSSKSSPQAVRRGCSERVEVNVEYAAASPSPARHSSA